MTHDAHTSGLQAVVSVARSAVGALRSATEDLRTDPKRAAKAVLEQSSLLSKSLTQIGKRLDQLPEPERTADAVQPLPLSDVQTALERLRTASENGLCARCGGVFLDGQ